MVTPKTVLSGTAMPTQRIVSQKACMPSGLVIASIGSAEAVLEGTEEDDRQRDAAAAPR